MRRRDESVRVLVVGDAGAPPLGTPDPDLLRWCEELDYVLVTNNRASMPRHLDDHMAAGGHVPGILVINPQRTLSNTVEELLTIAHASLESEHQDQIQFLPIT